MPSQNVDPTLPRQAQSAHLRLRAQKDWLTEGSAAELATIVAENAARVGWPLVTRVEAVAIKKRTPIWVVRSRPAR